MRRRYWIAGVVAAVAIVAAGSAVAATKLTSPKDQSKAIINDAAGRLHVAPSALSAALKKALADRVDAAVAAGRLTKKQGDAIKARIEAGQAPLLGRFGFGFGGRHFGDHDRGFGRGGFGFGFHHDGMLHRGMHSGMFGTGLAAVTSYLGITNKQLRTALFSGKSLAQIAKDHGKTADGLVAALVAAAKTRLDKAVTAKHLTAAMEKSILSRLQSVFESMVNNRAPVWSHDMHHGFGSTHPFRLPPPKKAPPSFKPSALPKQQA